MFAKSVGHKSGLDRARELLISFIVKAAEKKRTLMKALISRDPLLQLQGRGFLQGEL